MIILDSQHISSVIKYTNYSRHEAMKCELHDELVALFKIQYPDINANSDEDMCGHNLSFYRFSCAIHDFCISKNKDLYKYFCYLHTIKSCKTENTRSQFKYPVYFLLQFLIIYVNNGHTDTSHAEKIKYLAPLFTSKALLSSRSPLRESIFDDQLIEDIYIPSQIKSRSLGYILSKKEDFVSKTIISYVNQSKNYSMVSGEENINKIFCLYKDRDIKKPEDFTPELFIDTCKMACTPEYEKVNAQNRSVLLSLNQAFYKSLLDIYPEVREAFNNCDCLCPKLITEGQFGRMIREGYDFIPCHYEERKQISDNLCITVRGLNRISTRKLNHDYVCVYLTGLCHLYKDIILRWCFSLGTARFGESVNYVAKRMKALQEFKEQTNANLKSLTLSDIGVLAFGGLDSEKTHYQKTDGLVCVRKFLEFAEAEGLLTIDPNYKMVIEGESNRSKKKGGEAISLDTIKQLESYLRTHAKDSRYNYVHFGLFGLLCRLSFRISQLASLKITDIKETSKPGEYQILDESKTSGGNKRRYTILRNFQQILKAIFDDGEELRSKSKNDEYLQSIFVYETGQGNITIPNKQSFSRYMKFACEDLGISHVTAKTLRCSFNTNVKNWGAQNDISPLVTDKMTDHKDDKVIYDNYYDSKIAVEDDAEIIITGDFIDGFNINDKILNIPKDVNRTVANGVGECHKHEGDSCPATCLICKHFMTTTDYLPFFQNAIKELKQRKASAVTQHDIEDIDIWIELYASYELAIIDKLNKNNQ